jgi:protein subunit release factor A
MSYRTYDFITGRHTDTRPNVTFYDFTRMSDREIELELASVQSQVDELAEQVTIVSMR